MGKAKEPRLDTRVKKGDVSAIIKLVAQFSHETYAKLPMSYQVIWSVQDLMAYGVGHAVTYVVKHYDPYRRFKKYKKNLRKGAKNSRTVNANQYVHFFTYLTKALDNLYKELISEAFAEKRITNGIFSADSQVAKYKGQLMNLYDILIVACSTEHQRETVEDQIINRVEAEKAFLKVYSKASPKLRKHLINWCIQPKATKYKLSGKKFQDALKEFRTQGFDQTLTADLVRTIQTDELCRNRVVIATLGRAWNPALKNPGFKTTVRRNKPCLEHQLLTEAVPIEG